MSLLVLAVLGALAVGFAAGLFAFRIKCRWCPACGATTHTYADRVARAEGR